MTPRLFLSYALVAIGVLIAVTTGGCALFVIGTTLLSPADDGWTGPLLQAAFLVGVLPCVIGTGIAWLGVRLVRKVKPPRAEPVREHDIPSG
jgi:hypothetical protein